MEYQVDAANAGRKLRDVLRQVMGVSYSAMKSAKWDGRITVNGIPTPVDAILREGDLVAIRWKDTPAYTVRPYHMPLNISYEDEHLFVINKPAPLASQSSANHPDDSLENALFAHLNCPVDYVYRPVNRLDKGTSGLMLVAKTPHAQHLLQRMLHTPDFRRVYLAVVEGCPPDARGVVSAPIGKEETASIRRIITETGKPSLTHYEVLWRGENRSLVRLELETGRTHQIRVHMAHLGCPVAGDFLYGHEIPELPQRFALHSHEVFLRHPVTGADLHIVSPLPDQLTSLLD